MLFQEEVLPAPLSRSGKKGAPTHISNVLPISAGALQRNAEQVTEHAAKNKQKEKDRKEAATLVFQYWATEMGKTRTVLDAKRLKRLMVRLEENGDNVGELLYAVDGAKNDNWLMGRDPRTPRAYPPTEPILRDRSQVERLAETRNGYKQGKVHPLLREDAP
jgi:hypothetical protein